MVNTIVRVLLSLIIVMNIADIIIKIKKEDFDIRPIHYKSNICQIIVNIILIVLSYTWES